MDFGRGSCISFEGIDGSGKSTQAGLVYDYISSKNIDCSFYREPGNTSAGERIRSLLLNPSSVINPRAELLLYLAARSQLTNECIKPDIKAGKVVVLDRFVDSSTAYQGYARGLGRETVERLNEFATGGLMPDLTLFIDCEVTTSLSRIGSEPDRMESGGFSFLNDVRNGFIDLQNHHRDRYVTIDGNGTVEEVFEAVISVISERFHLL